MSCGEPGAKELARPVRRAGRGNGPAVTPAPRPGPTQPLDTVLFRRLYALVFIELATRQVHLAGITANPTGEWATPQARNIVETFVERPEPIRFLIHDRDSKFTAGFDEVFRSDGIRTIRTPVRSSSNGGSAPSAASASTRS